MSNIVVESAISLRNRRDPHYAAENACRVLRTRHGKQRKPCWSEADKSAMIDTCLRGWMCPPIYIITRMDLVDACDQGEDHVFDGAHKLEAVFDFIDGKFAYKSDKRFAELSGRRFAEMPREVQDRIKKYQFQINHIDAETAGDPDELRILWERVNKAGKQLNAFELDIPVIEELIVRVLEPVKPDFFETLLFPKRESKRGDLEQRLQLILALHDFEDGTISSQNMLIKNWHVKHLGGTMTERVASVEKNGEQWIDVLRRTRKMMDDLDQLNVFRDASGEICIQDALRNTELPFVLARLARRFPRIEDFRSKKAAIALQLKDALFKKDQSAIAIELGTAYRNGVFQRKLLQRIDELLGGVRVEPRLFTKQQKKAKLQEQDGKCAACGQKVLPHHLYDGDHVVAWADGGNTSMDNLQILHRHCHQAKTVTLSTEKTADRLSTEKTATLSTAKVSDVSVAAGGC